MKLGIREAAAATGAVSVLAGGLIGLPFEFIGDLALSGPLALLTGGGILAFWPSHKQVSREKQLDSLIEKAAREAGIDPREVVEAISTASTKLAKIRQYAQDIRAPNTTRRINKICAVGDKIIEDFRQDPKDVRTARSWIGTYLDQTIDIVKAYATLSRTGAHSVEAQTQMAQFDGLLDTIEDKFEELLKSLLENDVVNFDVNVRVMRNMLEQEGIRS